MSDKFIRIIVLASLGTLSLIGAIIIIVLIS